MSFFVKRKAKEQKSAKLALMRSLMKQFLQETMIASGKY